MSGAQLDGLSIRLAAVEDAPEIHAAMQEAYDEYRAAGTPSSALQETVDHVAGLLREGMETAVVGVCGGDVVATVRFHSEDGLYFSRLAVRPAFQGRGVAKALVAWLEEYARKRGESRIWCRVRRNVPRNVHLYESLGFVVTHEWEVVRGDGQRLPVAAMAKPV